MKRAIFIAVMMIAAGLMAGCSSVDKLAQKSLYPFDSVHKDYPSTEPMIEYPGEGPIIMYVHGNGENTVTVEKSGLADKLAQLGHLFVPDYPGQGPVPGVPSEATLVAKIKEDLNNIRRAHPDKRIVMIGRSLGAAVAAQVYDGILVNQVILISPWTTFGDAAKANKLGSLYKLVSDEWKEANEWSSISKAPEMNYPVIIHGDKDTLIPVDLGIEMAAAASTEPHILEGYGHNDIYGSEELWMLLTGIIRGIPENR